MLLGIESNLRKYTGQPTAGLNHRATILLDPQYIQYAGIHETTHAVLRHHTHSFNWDTLWREKIGPYDTKNPIHYIKASQVTPR